MFGQDNPEIAYYRAIEDLFAALRGVPHILSPKDFQLLRGWWRERIPLAAVRTGVTEVFARRRELGESEPVVSLSYCRHAVAAHAKKIAEMAVGTPEAPHRREGDISTSLHHLADRLAATAAQQRTIRPRVASVIDRMGNEVRSAHDIDPALVEQYLYALETTLLIDCLDDLEDDERSMLEERATIEAERVSASPEARDRTLNALRDRLLRELLALPRLEVDL
jgi:hypothetical protein